MLNSRRGAYTAEQGRVLDDLARGARVEILEADADTPAFQRLYTARSRRWHNLRNTHIAPRIIHAAGVSRRFSSLAATNSAALTEVLRAKVAGAWAMHQLSLRAPDLVDLHLLFFRCFSLGLEGPGSLCSSQCLSRRACRLSP